MLPPTEKIITATSPRARGFIEWKPHKKTAGLIEAIEDVLAEYADELPITVRQVYYRLIALERLPDKTNRAAKNLGEIIQKMRRAKIIPFDAIRDDGISEISAGGYKDEDHATRTIYRLVNSAELDRQQFQPTYQVVCCEAAGMAPQLAKVVAPYGISVISSGGFQSVTAKYALAQKIADAGKPGLVWHLGDYDPSGLHVYQSFAEDVTAFAGDYEISFQRLAVTPEQIDRYGLPMAPTKATDARTFDGRGTVQCEALPPNIIAAELRNAVAQFWDYSAETHWREATDQMQTNLQRRYAQ